MRNLFPLFLPKITPKFFGNRDYHGISLYNRELRARIRGEREGKLLYESSHKSSEGDDIESELNEKLSLHQK